MSIWSGEAPVPVVFLHGFATSTQMTWVEPGWFDLVKEGGRRPLGYDLLGHGDADTPDDIETYKDLVTPVVEQLPFTPDEGRQIDIVGYSLGARTALDLTLRHRVERTIEIKEVGKEVVDANARDLGHDEVVTPGDGLDDQPVGTVIAIAHPPVVARPGVDVITLIALGLTRQRHGE